jgi:hypothetical protein
MLYNFYVVREAGQRLSLLPKGTWWSPKDRGAPVLEVSEPVARSRSLESLGARLWCTWWKGVLSRPGMWSVAARPWWPQV